MSTSPKSPQLSEFPERATSNSLSKNGPNEEQHSPKQDTYQHTLNEGPGHSKTTKSVLFDTRSTVHTHSKKVQSGTVGYFLYAHTTLNNMAVPICNARL